jgi:hypothetical protein
VALYRIVVYLHVLGAAGWFLSAGLEVASLVLLTRARDLDAARTALAPLRANRVLGPSAALLVLVPGVYMAESVWSARPAWVGLGYLTFIAVFVLGAAVTGRATVRFERRLGEPSMPSPPLSALRYSLFARLGLLAGVTFAMVVKPDAAACVTSVLLGSVLGVAFAAAANRGKPALTHAPAAASRA